MKGVIAFLIALIIVSFLFILPQTRQEIVHLLTYNQCDTPIPYKLGSVDSQFGLSRPDVVSDMADATQVWSTAEGKQLFTYDAKASLTVNFVFDERTALNNQISQEESNAKQNSAALQAKIQAYEADSKAFEQKLANFEAMVRSFRGGQITEDQYNALISQQKELQAEADALNARAKELNLQTRDYNAGIQTLNQNVNQFNTEISQRPEEGLYQSDVNTISIYFADNRDELVHTLAHEFGHAMGMVHNAGATSIMYPYTTSSRTPTSQDLEQLAYICRDQSAIVHDLQVTSLYLQQVTQSLASRFSKK